jgi:hypothetical protein
MWGIGAAVPTTGLQIRIQRINGELRSCRAARCASKAFVAPVPEKATTEIGVGSEGSGWAGFRAYRRICPSKCIGNRLRLLKGVSAVAFCQDGNSAFWRNELFFVPLNSRPVIKLLASCREIAAN